MVDWLAALSKEAAQRRMKFRTTSVEGKVATVLLVPRMTSGLPAEEVLKATARVAYDAKVARDNAIVAAVNAGMSHEDACRYGSIAPGQLARLLD